MNPGAANTTWARCFVDELARAGVRDVVLAPGSRSTPLVMAFARDGRFRLRVHLDERSAAFFALGIGKAARAPAVILTTSGTAAANVFPAVVEANQSEAPLLVLTADRPPKLRGADANQTIDQVRLFGSHVREAVEVAPPTLDGPALRHLRTLACRAVSKALGPPAGAVHVNLPFDKPLEPAEAPEEFRRAHPLAFSGRPDGTAFVEVATGRRGSTPGELDDLADLVTSPTGVIVAGPSPDADRVGPAVLRLAQRTGYPVLADPLSGARYGPAGDAHVVAAYDLFLRDAAVADELEPDLVLRVGASPTSGALLDWISRHLGVKHVVIDGGGRWKDHGSTVSGYVHADPTEALLALADRLGRVASPDWTTRWRDAERAALAALGDWNEPHEGDVCGTVASSAPAGSTLFVSSSMPVRDLDAFGHPREESLRVFANRGASGIDGIVSTAFGVATRGSGLTVCVLGDIAFYHDQNGLLWSREDDARVIFVLLDNDGGGIFHHLPVVEHESEFTPYFATPHGLDLRHAAEMHGLDVRDVEVGQLRDALDTAIRAGQTTVLRVRTQRAENARRRSEVSAKVREGARRALISPPDGDSKKDDDR